MPCYDGRGAEADRKAYQSLAEAEHKIDLLTRLLCESEKLLRNTRMAMEASDELKEWWVRHREIDRQREEGDRRKR